MRGDKRFQRVGTDERRVTRKNHHDFCVADGPFGNEHRVPGAILRLLQHRLDFEGLDRGRNLFRLMANDRKNFFRRQGEARPDDAFHERPAAGRMQHFGKRRFEARTFSCGEDDDNDVFVRHGPSILTRPSAFDN